MMTDHFKKYGMIHLMWIIVILILVVLAFVVKTPGAQLVQDYISFAATFASLFLAIVAIFYSIVSSHNLAGSLTGTLDAVQRISRVSERLDSVSAQISEETRILAGEVLQVPASVRELQSSLTQRLDSFSATQLTSSPNALETPSSKRGNMGSHLSLYVLALMNETRTPVDTEKMRGEVDQQFGDILFGYLTCMRVFKPCDVELSMAGPSYAIDSLGNLKLDEARHKDFTTVGTEILAVKEKVDAYFGISSAAGPPELSTRDEGNP